MPNRIIKDSIRTSKSVNSLSDFEFRVWTYLITYVDDYGRGSADPELLKGFVFPRRKGVTEQQISTVLASLATTGMITLYEVDGESFLCFPNWDKHQRIQSKKSKFPAPQKSTVSYGDSRPEYNTNTNPESELESEEKSSSSLSAPVRVEILANPAVGSVISDFLDRINATAPKSCLDELANYAKTLGEAVCKRAFDIALAEKKTNWGYIHGILRNWSAMGVTCLADVDALEEEHRNGKPKGKDQHEKSSKSRIRRDLEMLRKEKENEKINQELLESGIRTLAKAAGGGVEIK